MKVNSQKSKKSLAGGLGETNIDSYLAHLKSKFCFSKALFFIGYCMGNLYTYLSLAMWKNYLHQCCRDEYIHHDSCALISLLSCLLFKHINCLANIVYFSPRCDPIGILRTRYESSMGSFKEFRLMKAFCLWGGIG